MALKFIYTDRSGTTSGTPSTSTVVMPANTSRLYFIVQNTDPSAVIWINFTGNANASQPSLRLNPGDSYESPPTANTSGEQISVLSTTASASYTAKEI